MNLTNGLKVPFLAVDLDGTLLYKDGNSKGGITDRNRAALKRYIERGGTVIIATGRHPQAGDRICQEFHIPTRVVGFNGIAVQINQQVTVHGQLSRDVLKDLIAFVSPHLEEIHPFMMDMTIDHVFIKPNDWPHEGLADYVRQDKAGSISTLTLAEHLQQPNIPQPIKVVCVCRSREIRNHWLPRMVERYGQQNGVVTSSERYIELLPLGCTKGTGLAKLASKLNIPLSTIAVIGDAANDVPMFKLTPYSFAMAHGEDDVKKQARYVVDDVAQAIEFILGD